MVIGQNFLIGLSKNLLRVKVIVSGRTGMLLLQEECPALGAAADPLDGQHY